MLLPVWKNLQPTVNAPLPAGDYPKREGLLMTSAMKSLTPPSTF